jgi:hypothetical protein
MGLQARWKAVSGLGIALKGQKAPKPGKTPNRRIRAKYEYAV